MLTPFRGQLEPWFFISPIVGAPLSDRNTIMESSSREFSLSAFIILPTDSSNLETIAEIKKKFLDVSLRNWPNYTTHKVKMAKLSGLTPCKITKSCNIIGNFIVFFFVIFRWKYEKWKRISEVLAVFLWMVCIPAGLIMLFKFKAFYTIWLVCEIWYHLNFLTN